MSYEKHSYWIMSYEGKSGIKKYTEIEQNLSCDTYVVHIDFLSVKHSGHTNISSFMVDFKHIDRIFTCTNAFQIVFNVFCSFNIWSNLKHKAEDLIISLHQRKTNLKD